MTIHVVGGVYRESCLRPRRDEIYGSAGRAAVAIAALDSDAVLHGHADQFTQSVFNDQSAWRSRLKVAFNIVAECVSFNYVHPLATPSISGIPDPKHAFLQIYEQKVIRFGMVDSDARVKADWAVYDPQNGKNSRPFCENGSSANHLALVLNLLEARHLAAASTEALEDVARTLASKDQAEVVVIKMGARGAFVWTATGSNFVPPYMTDQVWKTGSGDCYVAYFAYAWMELGKSPLEAAQFASLATAHYCNTETFPDATQVSAPAFKTFEPTDSLFGGDEHQVYLAGPFFDLSQVWIVDQARDCLIQAGLKVFSPYHDVGNGAAEAVVKKDLAAVDQSKIVFAILDGLDAGTLFEVGYAVAKGIPVVVYTERHGDSEDVKMMKGSGCVIRSDFTTAIYETLWKVAGR